MQNARNKRSIAVAMRGPPRQAWASAEFGDLIVNCLPQLRAFARSLTGHSDSARDLVQDAVARALPAEHSFTPGTNLRAWLFTILRNVHLSNYRRQQRAVVGSIDELAEGFLATPPQQMVHIELSEVARSLQLLPAKYREALLLISAMGMSYEEAAATMGCAIGTAKSRVNRARSQLARSGDQAPALTRGAAPAAAEVGLRRARPVVRRRPAAELCETLIVA
jgi:RNA polymerase sigma-70 factor (ECF subfamily)